MNKNELTIIKNHWRNGLFATTFKLVKKFIDKYPDNTVAWVILGDCYITFALFDNARKALLNAIKFCPSQKRSLPYHYMGVLYREKGNFKVAEKWHRKSLSKNPKESPYLVFLGSSLVRQGKHVEAKKIYQNAIKNNVSPLDEIYLNLGYIYRAEGKYQKAIECFEKALEIDEEYDDAKIGLKDCVGCY